MAQHEQEEQYREKMKFSDLKWNNLHPKAKRSIVTFFAGIFLLTMAMLRLLTYTTITLGAIDLSKPMGVNAALNDAQAILIIIGWVVMAIILWNLMFKDTPLTPAGKIKYDATHPEDKTPQYLKVLDAVGTGWANKGSGNAFSNIYAAAEAADPDIPKSASDNKVQVQTQGK